MRKLPLLLCAPLMAHPVVQSATNHHPAGHPSSTKTLASYGVGPRTLAIWKDNGRQGMSFRVVSFEKPDLVPFGVSAGKGALYEVNGANYFSQAGAAWARMGQDDSSVLGYLRVSTDTLEMTIDHGKTWIAGEKDDANWRFAFDSAFITMAPLDASFKPISFKVQAFERGPVVKGTGSVGDYFKGEIVMSYTSAVVAIAYGKNEFQGILKYPGTSFVVPLHGVKFGEKWVGSSVDSSILPLNKVRDATDHNRWIKGATYALGSFRKTLDIDLDASRLLIGTRAINYGTDGDPTDQMETADSYDLASAKDLPGMTAAFQANWSHSVWAKSDEPDSFSRAAEKAYAEAGLTTWFWGPYAASYDYNNQNRSQAMSVLNPLVARVKGFGGNVGLLDPSGNPVGQAASSAAATASAALPGNLPRIPIAAFQTQGGWVSVVTPYEVSIWSGDLQKVDHTVTLTSAELLTGAAASPDGSRFATSTALGVRLWDGAKDQSTLILPTDGCRGYWCVAFSPDGTRIAAGGNDGCTRIYDASTGKLLGATKESSWSFSWGEPNPAARQDRHIASLAFSSDGQQLATGAANGELKIWSLADPSSPKKLKSLDTGLGKVWRLQFFQHGARFLATNQTGSFQVLDASSWKTVSKADSTASMAVSMALTPDEAGLIIAHENGKVDETRLDSGAISKESMTDGTTMGSLISKDGQLGLMTATGFKSLGM